MRSLVQFALRRPRAAMAIWLVAVVALAVVGRGVDSRLQPSDLRISGSSSAVAGSLADAQFGRSASIPVLLSGPAGEVRSRGKALAARLGRERGVSVVSPWSAGPGRQALRPGRGRALMLVSMSGSRERIDIEARRVRDLAKAHAAGPVEVQVTGVPLAAHDVKRASAHAIHRAELIALPVLLLILLLVFRTPLAAAIPVAFGASTVLASQGLLTLLAGSVKLDAFATGLASMVGLALAIDYSLLVVTRVRERRGDGLAQRQAVAEGVQLSSRTVVVAGAAIVLAMILTAALSPTRPMLSAAVGVCTVAIVSVVGTAFALPAAMILAGDRIGTGGRRRPRSVWAPVSALVTRRPVLASAAAMILLLIAALPVVHLRTGAPDARELPASSQARQDFQAIRSVSGPGWGAGFELVSVARRGTMTTSKRLAGLAKLEATLRRDPAVRSVLGPGSIAKSATLMRRSGRVLARQETKLKAVSSRQTRGLDRLAGSVDQASAGVDSLEGALGDAGHAAGKLSNGSDAAAAGLTQLEDGMRKAAEGTRGLRARLSTAGVSGQAFGRVAGEARKGAQQVEGAVKLVSATTGRLRGVLRRLQPRIQGRVDALRGVARAARAEHAALGGHLDAAARSLEAAPQNSQTAEALAEVQKAKEALSGRDVAAAVQDTMTQLRGDMDALRGVVATLPVAKIREVARQAGDLRSRMVGLRDRLAALYPAAMSGLAAGSDDITAAMGRLDGGSGALAAGIEALTRGVGGMASGVKAGKQRSQTLAAGLRSADGAVARMRESRAALTRDAGRPRAASDATIDSGYFVLAALDSRRKGDSGLNVARGGNAARVLVIPRADVNSPATRALYKRLRGAAAQFGERTGTQTVAGGPAAMLIDYQQAMSARMLAIVLALAAATTLLLVIALRAVLVPLVGVALNVVCAVATLGIVERLFGGAHPALGGPGHVDPTSLTAIFAVMFALSIDYQMFIVSRIRDELAKGASVEAAIDTGMRRTAGVVTCAALSMLAVFMSFATAEVTSLRVFGVGLAVAVTLEATLVRLVLLPALLRLLGRRAWWPLTSAVEREHGPPLPAAGPQPAIPGQVSAPPCSS